MKKRILSIILTACMLLGLLPSFILALDITIPPYIDPDPTLEANALLAQMEQQKITPLPDDIVTPYDKDAPVTILEKAELYSYTSLSQEAYVGTFSNGKRTYESLLTPKIRQGLIFTTAVAFDPIGTGKRNHIAVLGYWPGNDNTDTAAYVSIINADTNTIVKEYELDKGWLGWARKLDTVDANNYFAITAGDYNGDGRDTLIIYDTAFRGEKGDRALKEIAFDGNNWPNEPKYLPVAVQGSELFNPEYVSSSLKYSWEPGERLQVALESGDVDGDGIDDLIVVSGAGDLTKENLTGNNYTFSNTRITIVAGKKGASSVEKLLYSMPDVRTETSMTAANVALGDIDGDGIDEIVVAGFRRDGSPKDSVKLTNGKLSYRIYDWDGHTYFTLDTSDNLENISAISKGDSLRTSENSWQQLSVECVSLDGMNSKEYIFINGYFYTYTGVGGLLPRAPGSDSLDVTDSDLQDDDHFAFNFLVTHCNGTDVNEVFIRSAAVGNLRADNGGRESIRLIVGFKTNKNNEYFFKAIEIYKDATGKWHQEGSANTYMPYDSKLSNTQTGICVSAVDIHNDSIIIRYNSTQSAYTDPNVVAFLQAAPYFAELGAGNSSTTYSYSESYTKSTTTGSGYSCGVGISANFETPVVKTEVETVVTSNVSEEFTESLTTEFTTTFEANDSNQVILRRTLLYLYCYDLLTGIDADGNPIYEDCGVVMAVPQYPVLTSLSMEQYDEFAQIYNEKYGSGVYGSSTYYLDLISKNDGALKSKYHLNNEGNPFAYASDASDYSKGFNMSNSDAWMELSHSGGTSQLAYSTSIGTENAKTATDGVSINMSVSVGSSFAGFGSSVGVSSSLESLRSHGVSTGQVTTTQTGGSVQNLGADAEDYKFVWQLIGWKTNPDDSLFKDVLFVGYAVKEVSAPPACVNDLRVEYTDTPGSAILHWTFPEKQEGREEGFGYEVFRTDNGKRQSITSGTFIGGTRSVTVSSTDPTATYVVVIHTKQSSSERGNLSSIDSNEALVVFATTADQVKKLIQDAGGDIDAAIAALKEAIEKGQAEAIAKAIADLTAAYEAADKLLKDDIANLSGDLTTLEGKLAKADEALQTAIDAVQKNLDKAIADLTALMESGDTENAEALQKAITDLTAAYKAADELLKADIADLSDKLTALEKQRIKADEALQAAIDAVQRNLDKAIADLTALLESGDTENAEALQKAIADLTAAYKAADDLLKANLTDLSGKLAALDEKLTGADEALRKMLDQVQADLDKAVAELTKATADGDAAAAARLNEAIEALTQAYKAADELLNSRIDEMNASMEKADQSLQNGQEALRQEIADLRSELQALKEQIAAQDLANSEKMQATDALNLTQDDTLGSLKVVATIGLCVSVVSFLGNVTLLVLYLLEKKKRLTPVS